MAREGTIDNNIARRTLNVLGWSFAVAVPALVVAASYFEMPISFVLSYVAADTWCDAPTQGIGIHCFGDFQFPRVALSNPAGWNGGLFNYSPTGMWPHVAARWLEKVGLGVRGSLVVYLVALGSCVLTPAVWAARRLRAEYPAGIAFALLGGMTLPFFSVMDRGNSVGFAVPALLAFFLTLRSADRRLAPIFLVVAAMIRIQFAVVGLALLVVGKRREAGAAAMGFLGVSVLSFVQWSGHPWSDFQRWLSVTRNYGGTQALSDAVPVNLSMARSLTLLLRGFGDAPDGVRGQIEGWVTNNTFAITVIVGLLTGAVVLLVGSHSSLLKTTVFLLVTSMVAPSVTNSYYLVVTLVIAALLVVQPWSPDTEDGANDAPDPWDRWWNVAVLIALVVSLVPIPVRLNPAHQSIGLEAAGPTWLVVWCFTAVSLLRSKVASTGQSK